MTAVSTGVAGWPYERVVAHRGGGTIAPENTLAGMRAAAEHGLRAVEFDVMMAGDRVPVLMHDPQLGRTISGGGAIDDIPSDALQRMDAGSWLDPVRFRGEPVPRFDEAVRWLNQAGIWMNIEIKPTPGRERETGEVVAGLTDALFAQVNDPAALPLFSSFSFDAMVEAQRVAPRIPRGWLVSQVPDDWQARLEQLGAVALHTNHRHLTARQAADVKAAGYGLFCYTVNEPARARELLSWGVDAFCTDRIDLFARDFS